MASPGTRVAAGERGCTDVESVLVSYSHAQDTPVRPTRTFAALKPTAPDTRPGRTSASTFSQVRGMHGNPLRSRERSPRGIAGGGWELRDVAAGGSTQSERCGRPSALDPAMPAVLGEGGTS